MEQQEQKAKLVEGHPIYTYFQEVDVITNLISELEKTNVELENQKWFNIFNELSTIEKRFQRKENQLFPYLEKKGWNGPSKGMWSFHDTLRDQIRLLRRNYTEKEFETINKNLPFLLNGIIRLIEIEETTLFPNSLQLLSESEWMDMRKGEDEIGWMLKDTPEDYPKNEFNVAVKAEPERTEKDNSDGFKLNEGYMTLDQINLLFKTMPLDITFVDEHDKVIFYNRGEERVFPRSAGIIGREVRFCHPPKSVETVLEILEKFKKGEQNEASFWINFKEQLIYIRYFAVRDENLNYKGVIELSQDITEIKKIEGEKRLLDWAN